MSTEGGPVFTLACQGDNSLLRPPVSTLLPPTVVGDHDTEKDASFS